MYPYYQQTTTRQPTYPAVQPTQTQQYPQVVSTQPVATTAGVNTTAATVNGPTAAPAVVAGQTTTAAAPPAAPLVPAPAAAATQPVVPTAPVVPTEPAAAVVPEVEVARPTSRSPTIASSYDSPESVTRDVQIIPAAGGNAGMPAVVGGVPGVIPAGTGIGTGPGYAQNPVAGGNARMPTAVGGVPGVIPAGTGIGTGSGYPQNPAMPATGAPVVPGGLVGGPNAVPSGLPAPAPVASGGTVLPIQPIGAVSGMGSVVPNGTTMPAQTYYTAPRTNQPVVIPGTGGAQVIVIEKSRSSRSRKHHHSRDGRIHV